MEGLARLRRLDRRVQLRVTLRRPEQDVPDRRRVPLPASLRGRHVRLIQVGRDLAQRVAVRADAGSAAPPAAEGCADDRAGRRSRA